PPVRAVPCQWITSGELRAGRGDAANGDVAAVGHHRTLSLGHAVGVGLQRRIVIDERETRAVVGLPDRRARAALRVDAATHAEGPGRAAGNGSDEDLALAAVLLERRRDLAQWPDAGAQPRARTRIAMRSTDLRADCDHVGTTAREAQQDVARPV